MVVEIGQLVNEISSFPEVPYKRGDLENFSKFTDKRNKVFIRVVIQRCLRLMMFLKILQNSHINIFARFSFSIKLQAGNLKLSEAATGDVLQIRCF